MTCSDVRIALGVYVLGSLEPAERSLVDRHLAGCPICRDELAGFAGLPALLGRLRTEEVEEGPARADAALLDRILTDLDSQRTRRRRQLGTAGAVAAAAAVIPLALGIAALVRDDPPRVAQPVAARTFSSTSGTVHAEVAADRREWGTEFTLKMTGIAATERCLLLVVAKDGRKEIASWWGGTRTGALTVPGATSFQLADLKEIDVNLADGRTLVSFWP